MTTARRLAVGFAIGRIAFAAALAARPHATARRWVGEATTQPGGRVAVRGLAARDGVLSGGVAVAAIGGWPMRPWLLACVASDSADIAATLADREGLPERSALGTVAIAGAAGAAGAALAVRADR